MQNSIFFSQNVTQNSQYAADLQNVQFKYKHWVLVAPSQKENIKINELVTKSLNWMVV